jgi:hypothetical protein
MNANALQAIIDRVLEIDDGVMYAAIADPNGSVLVRGRRPGSGSLNFEKLNQKLMLRNTLGFISYRSCEGVYGKCRYALIDYDKLTLLQFSFHDLILNIALDNHASVLEVLSEVTGMLSGQVESIEST